MDDLPPPVDVDFSFASYHSKTAVSGNAIRYNRTFEVIPMLMVAVIWYLAITSVLNVGQGFIERYYARGERGSTQAAPVVIAEPTP